MKRSRSGGPVVLDDLEEFTALEIKIKCSSIIITKQIGLLSNMLKYMDFLTAILVDKVTNNHQFNK